MKLTALWQLKKISRYRKKAKAPCWPPLVRKPRLSRLQRVPHPVPPLPTNVNCSDAWIAHVKWSCLSISLLSVYIQRALWENQDAVRHSNSAFANSRPNCRFASLAGKTGGDGVHRVQFPSPHSIHQAWCSYIPLFAQSNASLISQHNHRCKSAFLQENYLSI